MFKFYQELYCLGSNTKGKFFIFFFRISSYQGSNILLLIFSRLFRLFYSIIVQWFMGIDVPPLTKIGFGFTLFHGTGLVIHRNTIIGKNVRVRQSTTIGTAKFDHDTPVIGDNVDIGANTVIIGAINVGDNVIIGAGSVVTKDIPSNSIVVGNPARVVYEKG
ncbi:serine acetyltransferase [Alteromonas sp. LMIT006]|uniref:serine O-acetyltransferase n=1 Tax=Alteromonadaceae TaxID=72275 RepID=UPI0020CA5340|nr:DapH/DapD/GlmU-related protein [Alteromonas sp. LMIT006]UTP71919.1 serine acetyltransferase [Alteromonas sp. LMIT006]